MLLYKLLSLFLEYPPRELCECWDEVIESIHTLQDTREDEKQVLLEFVAWAQSLPVTKFQEEYVRTFDLNPSNALYLTHHLFEEEDRDRGPALVELSEFFKSEGFEIRHGELPDYLPLVLEYISTLDDKVSARMFLTNSSHVSEILANNLEAMNSPYAPLLRIIERHGRITEVAA